MFSRFLATRGRLQTARVVKRAILVTGCDSGFGYSLCRHLIEQKPKEFGVVIAGCYLQNKDGAEDLKQRAAVAPSGSQFHVVKVDLSNDLSIKEASDEVKKILVESNAELYCLINNAATLIFADAVLQTSDQIMQQYKVNVIGPMSLIRSLTPELIKSKGRVVNMISFCSSCPLPTLSVYTATKASLMRLSEGLRTEMARFGVDVVLFNPGDNPRETPLCAGQLTHYKEMEKDVYDLYKDNKEVLAYFESIKAKFTAQFPMPDLHKIDNPGFYKEMDKILTANKPNHWYTNSDLITKAFFWIVNNLPSWIGDKIRIKMMRLPPF